MQIGTQGIALSASFGLPLTHVDFNMAWLCNRAFGSAGRAMMGVHD